jgi:hypothetical protein
MPIWLDAEKLRVEQGVEHSLARPLFNPAQTLHLFGFQPHSRHFQILGADSVGNFFNRSHGNLLEMQPATAFAFDVLMLQCQRRRVGFCNSACDLRVLCRRAN